MTSTTPDTTHTPTTELAIDGMHCAGCVATVEGALRAVPGVQNAEVSLVGRSARILGRADPDALAQAVRRKGFRAQPVRGRRSVRQQRTELEHHQHAHAAAWKRRFLVGAALVVPMKLIHWAGPAVGLHGVHEAASVWGWMIFALATIVQVYVGSAFYASAFKAARGGGTNMDTLVSMGATAAYILSLVGFTLSLAAIEHAIPSYFAEAGALLTLISLGHWLEARSTAAAGSAVRELLALQPDEVEKLARSNEADRASGNGKGTMVASAEIVPGDLMLIRPGQRVAVDGRITRGRSSLDESIVTGEPLPVDRDEGEPVIAGSMNLSGLLVVEATTEGVDTTVARIAEMVRQAQSGKTQIQKLADRVSAIFVPSVIAVAIVAALAWGFIAGQWVAGIIYATTVLVISCPCALGLATPTAVMVGSGAASKGGVLVKSARVMERLPAVKAVLLDKTGTLTAGRPRVVDVKSASGEASGPATDADSGAGFQPATSDILRLAAALAAGSNHPLSRAITEAAEEQGLDIPEAESVSEEAGVGLTGRVEGARIRLISWQAASEGPSGQSATGPDEEDLKPTELRDLGTGDIAGRTANVLIRDNKPLGAIAFEDQLRPDAPDLIETLRTRGLRVMVLTGDHRAAAIRLAQAVGIPEQDVLAELSPRDKLAVVRDQPGPVAMVGDGINDAAALAETSRLGGVGIAIGTGANIAVESADVVIPGQRLAAIPELLTLSRLTLRTIKQNLFLSFMYNTAAIPVAALGLLGMRGPLIAAAAMGLSSICVVGNSLRLKARLGKNKSTTETPRHREELSETGIA